MCARTFTCIVESGFEDIHKNSLLQIFQWESDIFRTGWFNCGKEASEDPQRVLDVICYAQAALLLTNAGKPFDRVD